MSNSDKKTQYNISYAKEKLKRIPLDVPKSDYEIIKAHSEAMGEPVNGFIKRAISETMARDKAVTGDSVKRDTAAEQD